jgi:prolipoprotein diacylglyceryltransferase
LVSLGVLLGGILGARLVTGWESLDDMGRALDDGAPLSYVLMHGNKSVVGALIGGYLGGVLTKRSLGYTRSTGDAYVLALPIALAIGRIGCFLTELPLGKPTTLPWGLSVSPSAAAAFPTCPGCGGPMHPTMLYEIAFNVVAAWLIWRFRRRVPVPGDTLKLYLIAAGTFRFLVEFLRASPPQALGLTAPQWVLIPMLVLLVIHFARQLTRRAWLVPSPAPALEVLA